MLAEKVPDDVPVVFLLPVLRCKSDEHGGFVGTVSLSAETMIAVLTDIGGDRSRRAALLALSSSGHGGNSECMGIAARRLRERHGMAVVATNFMRFGLPDGSCLRMRRAFRHSWRMIETSLMLHLPDQVDRQRPPILLQRPKRWRRAMRSRIFLPERCHG
ncbi:MAG: creatininase family protein [Rhodobiaceae bacterium]|nr:creatininase family protein [Rhodobiaceae bacterium]